MRIRNEIRIPFLRLKTQILKENHRKKTRSFTEWKQEKKKVSVEKPANRKNNRKIV